MRYVVLCLFLFSFHGMAQPLHDQKDPSFSRKDTLRGMLTPLRTSYDVTYYHLDIRVDPQTQSIAGSNKIRFKVMTEFDKMQVDLFENMEVERITLDDKSNLPFTREYDAVFITLPKKLKKNSSRELTVYYSGKPIVAKRPPWEGGFIWTKDKDGNPWVAVACQGMGASLWWPNKDHQSDEPDSMMISVTVPSGLMNVSNGRLRKSTALKDGWRRFDWFVSYPINNYNVTVNIGKFAHFNDFYLSGRDTLKLDYYVMPENLDKAKKQFEQVKPMLVCFEKYFGKYPFWNDGFKEVESPHLGMEHQSALAYGNNYLQGYRGTATSEVGLKFDFIIIHEAAHEWWGNNVTSKDIADMWIHESFGAYAEALYVECLFGYEEALKYINAKKFNVINRQPIIGVYGVNKEGSKDMYDKGQLVLNTLRHVINNDELWISILSGIQHHFRHQTVTAENIIQYVNKKTNSDLTYFFNQYLRHAAIPELEINLVKTGDRVTARYRWNIDVPDFAMPVKVTTSKNSFEMIYPKKEWGTSALQNIHPDDFKVATDQFYIDVKVSKRYVDPREGG